MRIGMIVAIPEEIEALFTTFGSPAGKDIFPGYEVMKYDVNGNQIFVTGSGAGEIAAASSTQLLITKYGVELIVNFGVVGGLTEDMKLQSTVVIEKLVHYDYDASPFMPELTPAQYPGFSDMYICADEKYLELALKTEPSLKKVTCASADKFIEDPLFKKKLNESYGAKICEMESAGILLTCKRNEVPALFIKAVSDSVDGDASMFGEMVHEAAKTCVNVLLNIIRNV